MENLQLELRTRFPDVEEIGVDEKELYTLSDLPLQIDLKSLLIQVTGRDDVENITEANLKDVVSATAGFHRLAYYTPKLVTLILDGSFIRSLRELGSSLKNLRTLSAVGCNLKSLDGLWGFRRLRVLIVRENSIIDPSPCSGVRKLAKLDIADNDIIDISYLAFLRTCKYLRELNISGNRFGDYKDDIQILLPKLRVIDGEKVERNDDDSKSDSASDTSEDSDYSPIRLPVNDGVYIVDDD